MSGLYVNSNVSSLVAQNALSRNMNALNQSLTRLSTGLRINSGKDDPSGLIASEILKSDIAATSQAIENTQRANSMVAIADSALGQVSNLLNDIRTLINEAANDAAMNDDQIAANQLQIDAALDSIDRIARTTNYMGKNLLDGSLDFQTQGLSNQLADLTITSANFGTQDHININVDILKIAESAKLIFDQGGVSEKVILEIGGSLGSAALPIEAGTSVVDIAKSVNLISDSTGVRAVVGQEATKGQLVASSAGANNDILITATEAGSTAGDYSIKFSAGNSTETTVDITYPSAAGSGMIEFFLKMEPWTAPSTTNLGESTNGVVARGIQFGADPTDILFLSSSNGIDVRTVEFVQATNPGGNPNAAAANLRSDGVLEIEYRVGATGVDIAQAISNIVGLTASIPAARQGEAVTATGIHATSPASVFVDTSGAPTYTTNPGVVYSTSVYGGGANTITLSTMPGVELSTVEYVASGNTDNVVTATMGAGGALSISFGSLATGDDLIKAINAAGLGIKAVNNVAGNTAIAAAGAAAVTQTGNGIAGNNGLDIASKIDGLAFENTDVIYIIDPSQTDDVEFMMTSLPSKAAGTLTDGANTLTFTAKEDGNAFNNVTIRMMSEAGASPGMLSVSYSENGKELIIRGNFGGGENGVSYEQLIAAVAEYTPFRLAVTDTATGNSAALGQKIGTNFAVEQIGKTGQTADTVGTDNRALIIKLKTGLESANDVVTAINDTKNAQYAAYFSITNTGGSTGQGQLFQNGHDKSMVFTAALTGGSSGYQSSVSANELIDFINNHEVLSQIISAENYLNSNGYGLVTVFDEFLRYGDVDAHNALQFLGPEGSPDVRFIAEGNNSELGIVFTGDYITLPQAYLTAYDVNAAMSITGLVAGEQLNDTVVRFVRLNNNYDLSDSYVTYTEGPSNSMAYCSINDDLTTTGTAQESGKFIVYSTEKGERYNNVNIVARLDENQTAAASTYYNEATKELIITVNSKDVTLSSAMDAINRSGLFTCDFDYSYNRESAPGAGDDTGPGIETFAFLFAGTSRAVIGNTGETGGYAGGVIEVAIGGYDYEMTANNMINIINGAEEINGLFVAAPYDGSTGEGLINFRYDNLTEAVDGCYNEYKVPRMVIGGGVVEKGIMEVHLATDQYGNPTTTAQEFVDFFNSLTAEQTRGISVSLMYPTGAFTNDICDDTWGDGIIQPTRKEYDICEDDKYYSLSFETYGSNILPTNAYADIVAVNGKDASYRLVAKMPGPEYEGVTLTYEQLDDDETPEYATYEADTKHITVYINNRTTANDVQRAIETSQETKSLFGIVQAGSGNAAVTIRDDSVMTAHGTYEAGYRGGADLLGATDEDPHKLIFESVNVGSGEYVSVIARAGTFNVKDENGNIVTIDYGTDTEATLNGQSMVGNGLDLSLSTSMLSLKMTLKDDAQTGDNINFDIVGGGATFQLGPDVVSSQQIRIGIKSVNTATLGGASGKLYMLRDGGSASLRNDVALADKIIQETISAVTSLRGQLGALQKYTLESNIVSLQDNLEALSSAEAEITDADFAQETSNLTRAQILVQSGISVLQIANQIPQYAASLIG